MYINFITRNFVAWPGRTRSFIVAKEKLYFIRTLHNVKESFHGKLSNEVFIYKKFIQKVLSGFWILLFKNMPFCLAWIYKKDQTTRNRTKSAVSRIVSGRIVLMFFSAKCGFKMSSWHWNWVSHQLFFVELGQLKKK